MLHPLYTVAVVVASGELPRRKGRHGVINFAGKTVWSMPERFECTTLAKKALYKYSSFRSFFPFTEFPQFQKWSHHTDHDCLWVILSSSANDMYMYMP